MTNETQALPLSWIRLSLIIACAAALAPSSRADEQDPPPQPNVSDLFGGAASFQDNVYIGDNDDGANVQEMKAIQVGSQVYAYYRTYVGLPYDNCSIPNAIGLAISNDGGASFTPYNGGAPVVSMGSYGEWDDCYVIAPSVTQGPDGTFYMAYEGMNHAGYVAGDIGLATSPDGINWTKQGPILYHQPGGWENGNIGTPSIHYFNGTWYVFFHGDNAAGRECRGFAAGSSPYPGGLSQYGGNPVICPDGPGTWDSAVIGRGDIYYDGSYYYMVFEGNSYDGDGGAWGWGVAISQDLVNWSKYWGNPIRQSTGGFGADVPSWFVTPDNVYVYYNGVNVGINAERDVLVSGGGLPTGSYTETCLECSETSVTLSCGCCYNESQQCVSSALVYYPQCIGDISNQNGQLACNYVSSPPAPPPPPPPPGLPSGSYSASCQSSCSMSGNALICSCCLSESGQCVNTTLTADPAACSSDISNQNGYLECSSDLPSGSYGQTCGGCDFSNNTLSCSCCYNESSQCVDSEPLQNISQCVGDISNQNGQLACNYASNPPPPPPPAPPAPPPPPPPPPSPPSGSYSQSCNSCSESGSAGSSSGIVLSCSCPNFSGGSVSSSLSASGCAAGSIGNYNGYLTCSSASGLFGGSYLESCDASSCYLSNNGNTLNCSCQAENGQYESSSLDLTTCVPSSDIGNDNGQLDCATQ